MNVVGTCGSCGRPVKEHHDIVAVGEGVWHSECRAAELKRRRSTTIVLAPLTTADIVDDPPDEPPGYEPSWDGE